MENEMKDEQEKKTDSDLQRERYEALVAQNLRMKKRFLRVMLIVGAALILLFVSVVGINVLLQQNAAGFEENIVFDLPYEGDIFEYAPYLALDRKIYYFDGMVKRSIEKDNLHNFDSGVLFLCDFINVMKNGDVAAYNASFTVNPNQAEFSQQMIYDTLISYVSSGVDTNGDQLIRYQLEYRLYFNDGTLRTDVARRHIKPQYVTLRISARGDISIDSLTLSK